MLSSLRVKDFVFCIKSVYVLLFASYCLPPTCSLLPATHWLNNLDSILKKALGIQGVRLSEGVQREKVKRSRGNGRRGSERERERLYLNILPGTF